MYPYGGYPGGAPGGPPPNAWMMQQTGWRAQPSGPFAAGLSCSVAASVPLYGMIVV